MVLDWVWRVLDQKGVKKTTINRLSSLYAHCSPVVFDLVQQQKNKCDESPIERASFWCYIYVSRCDQAVYRSVPLSRHAKKMLMMLFAVVTVEMNDTATLEKN